MAKCKRLNLNWQLEWRDERTQFINSYLEVIPFKPTEDELEMMGNYILWGKNRQTGLNGRQEGLQLETAAGTWDAEPVESLDALLESPTFNESMLRQPDMPVYKAPREVFSRSDARRLASPELLCELESLWRTIDETELLLAFYDLDHQKRTSPPRAQLLSRFNELEILSIHERAQHLNSYKYLQQKHSLVELRQQQYLYKDSYAPLMQTTPTFNTQVESPTFFWGTDIHILPLGLKYANSPLTKKLWRTDRFPEPKDFNDSELQELTKLLWRPAPSTQNFFNFENPAHLYLLDDVYLAARENLNVQGVQPLESNFNELLDTYDSYVALAQLPGYQWRLLQLKRQHVLNEQISSILGEEFGRPYTVNYISTLYHQNILGAIAQTARKHREVCENLMFPENFKLCSDCGRWLLRNAENFTRKIKAKDGFDCRCKSCAKKLREKRKQKHEEEIVRQTPTLEP